MVSSTQLMGFYIIKMVYIFKIIYVYAYIIDRYPGSFLASWSISSFDEVGEECQRV